jgi:hypothetical protein
MRCSPPPFAVEPVGCLIHGLRVHGGQAHARQVWAGKVPAWRLQPMAAAASGA